MNDADFNGIVSKPLNAVLGTNRRNGAPQLSPIWYLFADGRFYISVSAASAKARNIRRDPRISVCFDEGHPDGRSVTVYGRAELIDPASAWGEDMYRRITRRYFDSDEAWRRYEDEKPDWGPSVIIVVTPDRIVSHDTE